MSEHESETKVDNTPDNSWVEAGYARLAPLMGRVTVLVGKPGTGKSRLLGEVLKQRGGISYANEHAQVCTRDERSGCDRVNGGAFSNKVKLRVLESLNRMGLDEGLFHRWANDYNTVGLGQLDLLSNLTLAAAWLKKSVGSQLLTIDDFGHSLPPKLAGTLIKEVARLTEAPKSVLIATHSPAVIRGLDLRDDSQRLLLVSLEWGETPELGIERLYDTSSERLEFLMYP